MTVIYKWSGNNAPLGALGTSTAGDGDQPFNHRVGPMMVAATGSRPTAISIPDAQDYGRCGWAGVPDWPLSHYAVRVYARMTGYPTGSLALIQSNNTGVQSWRVEVTAEGRPRLRVGSGNSIAWEGTAQIPLDSPVRFEVVNADSTVTVTAYLGDSMTVLDSGGGAGGPVEAIWFGSTTSVQTAGLTIDDMAFADTAELIGSAVSHVTMRRFNGTAWVPMGRTRVIGA